MKAKTKKATTPLKRYIVEWVGRDKLANARVFPNLPRARGWAKEFRETVQYYCDAGGSDGAVKAIIKSIKIYSATLEPVEVEEGE